MAAKTTAADGDWGTGATWTGGTKPATGDTITINHNVTVNEAIDIGASGNSASVAMVVASGKTLTFSDNLDHIIRGGIEQNGSGFIDIGAGVDIYFNTASAAAPTTTHWIWQIGNGHNNNCRVRVRGTSGNRTTIRGSSGGGYFYSTDGTGPWLQAGLWDAEYTDFSYMGGASTDSMKPSCSGTTTFRLYRCTLDTCGKIDNTYNIGADCTYQILETTFKNSLNSVCLRLNNTNTKTGGTRELYDNVFDEYVELFQAKDFKNRGNFFNHSFGTTDGDWDATEGFQNNFVLFQSGDNNAIIAGNTKDNFWFWNDPTNYNPHFIECLNYGRDQVIDGDIFDCDGDSSSPAQEGDAIMLDDALTTDCAVTIQNVIVLKGPGGKTVGTLFSALGNSHTYVEAYHCTVFSGIQGAAVGETYAGFAGMVLGVKSCIFWSETSGQGYKVYDSGPDNSVTDLAAAADLDYNCGYNLAAGSNGKGYDHLEFSSGSPGANDITQNPDFVNRNANLASWDASNGGPGTIANALTQMRKRNDSDFNSAYLITGLFTYIRGAFMPQNLSLQNAAHDGGDIGAVEIVTGGAGTGKSRMLLGVG